eukprot:TRINITY_DN2251_c0_g1_i1.p1 TRINITY_DN2251_c0_g1~~TRINITY_DN2251_c0_g1_i1.p1  ORF type:complete len:592 (-),score=120.62 TRINITY_DN2251_c0_g1_i1:355-2130(-)
MATIEDYEESRFTEYPEPPEKTRHVPDEYPKDGYLEGLDRFVLELSDYVRDWQKEEGKKLIEESDKLKTMKPPSAEGEREEKRDYSAGVASIKKRRKNYRAVLKDAMDERQKFFDSMLQQKQEQELVRLKLERLKVPTNDRTSIREKTIMDYFFLVIFAFEIVITLIFFTCVIFTDSTTQNHVGGRYRADDYYSYLIHISLLTFFGFGGLLVFLRRGSFSGIGFNFFVCALVAQLALLTNLLFYNIYQNRLSGWQSLEINISDLILAVYASATVSISFGALCGKIHFVELFLFAIAETFFFSLNYYINIWLLKVVDPGGAMTIHLFGSFYGLAASYWLSKSYNRDELRHLGHENYTSYPLSFVTLASSAFVFVLMPSFNAALAPDGSQYRVTVNTFVAMVGGACFAFFVSKQLRRKSFHITDVHFSILAAGVAMASGHSALIKPGGALLIGCAVGMASVIFFAFLQPWLEKRSPLKVFDTRGVNNVHGIPGIVGGFASAIALSQGGSTYGQPATDIFPRGLPTQGGYQAACIFISLGISIVAGFATGFVLWVLRRMTSVRRQRPFQDSNEFNPSYDYPADPFDFSREGYWH